MLFRREPPATDGLPHSPAAARNREPIAAVLERHLPKRGTVLEIASGTGEHVQYFAARFPGLVWQPSDADPAALAAVRARQAASRNEEEQPPLRNLREPIRLDVARPDWTAKTGLAFPVALVAINLIHIAPWRATEGLLSGAGRLLMSNRQLFVYGPFKRGGRHTARSNGSFDAMLRRQNSEWGVRDLERVVEAAGSAGFAVEEVAEMPANNLTVVFTRR